MSYSEQQKTLLTTRLKARLIAATLSHREYLTFRNTVRVLRLSGAPLDPEQEQNVRNYEAVVAAYEEQNFGQGANG
jgi:hypothetical protein